ncbi:MAG: ferrous iron transport protein A [Mycobacterium sp.]|nr:ferrous iron transport protein A [Mycobacterium sp.]
MSIVSDRLSERRLLGGASSRAAALRGARTLADLERGQTAVVVGYAGGVQPSAVRRLFDLGLAPGVAVTMVRRAPLRDPAVYLVGDYEIALRRAQSRCIEVEVRPVERTP